MPGDGCVDYTGFFRILADHGYDGWVMIEAEQDPKKADPVTYSKAGLAHCLAAHVSAEPGHRLLLARLKLTPLLDLNLRLGEASGAVLAVGLVRAALACHTGMASFSEAGVSGHSPGA